MSDASRADGPPAPTTDLASFARVVEGLAADTCASALDAAHQTGRRPYRVAASARWMTELAEAVVQAEGFVSAALAEAGFRSVAPALAAPAARPTPESLEQRMASLRSLLDRTFDD